MSPESFDLARAWMIKSRSDLATARVLITGDEKHLDTGSYHCQQAAEKILKAWLTAQEVLFPKTHSLEELLALCIPSEAGFAHFRRHCEELTPLAHEFRYPGDVAEPDPKQAERGLSLAEQICGFGEGRMGAVGK